MALFCKQNLPLVFQILDDTEQVSLHNKLANTSGLRSKLLQFLHLVIDFLSFDLLSVDANEASHSLAELNLFSFDPSLFMSSLSKACSLASLLFVVLIVRSYFFHV